MKRVSDLLQELDKISQSVSKTVKRPAPPPVEPVPPPAEQPRKRTIHLGLDYGTASSKLVLRDYEPDGRERAYIVFPSAARGKARDFRIPSLIALEAGRLWFGLEAAARQSLREVKTYPSMKMRMAMPQEFHGLQSSLPEGLAAEDLSTLTVAYLLQEGLRAAEALAKRYRSELAFSFTLGVPMSDLDNSHLRGHFADLARRAWQIVQTPSTPDLRTGIPALEGWMLVSDADEAMRKQPATDPRRWTRPELEASLLWSYRSEGIEPGVYATVDVGAGTTNASFFHVGPGETKPVAAFGAACLAPGADAVDAALIGFGGTSDPLAIRAKENSIIQRVGDFPVTAIAGQIVLTYQRAFDRAWEKNPKASAWEGYRLFLTGGGSDIEIVKRKLGLRAGTKLRQSPQLVEAAPPPELELDGVAPGDVKFLNVAYGLSHFDADIPSVALTTDSASVVLRRP